MAFNQGENMVTEFKAWEKIQVGERLSIEQTEHVLSNGVTIVIMKFYGNIDSTTVLALEKIFSSHIERHIKNIIVTFSEVRHVNSTGLAVLVNTAISLKEQGGGIKLVEVPEKFIILLDMGDMRVLFDVYRDENLEDALKALETKSSKTL